jgi:serine/threonine protein phosphatase PrpC
LQQNNSFVLGQPTVTTATSATGAALTITSEEHATGSVTSIKGLKPGNPNWINQDNFFLVERFDNKDINFYCVLDGHGENGHHVSKKCRENFPHHIKATNIDMRRAFGLMQNDLLSSDFDVRCSGATCTLAMVSGNRLAVSNCGDSRAVLGRRNPNGSVAAHALTYDHKPDKPEERRRILSCGGHLGCRQVVVNQPGKGPVSVPVGPCRVWYQHMGETLGLAMSRSLGDSVVHRCGVSAEPETLEHTIDEYDEFIVIATDGVWDVLDNNQVVQMVANFSTKTAAWNPSEVSATIVKFARSRWEKLSPMVDDITCIVVKLKR